MISSSQPACSNTMVFSKWSLDSNSTGFVDEAQCTIAEDSQALSNTVTYSVHTAQVEAYSPGEDRIYVNETENLFAVFDGHGGDICSRYIVDKLPSMLLGSLKTRRPTTETEYAVMFKSTFMKADEQFLREHKSIVKTCPAGSCGLTVMIKNDTLYMCNLGDSRVLLGSKSQSWSHTLLTNDHNTKNQKECELVKRRTTDPNPIRGHLCNKVEGERVGGILMVTRAFGDGIFKRKDMSLHPLIQHLPYITSEPEVTTHKLSSSDQYVVISSDGLYEYFTPADVAEIVEQHLESGMESSKIPCALIEKQFEKIGSLVGKTAEQVKKAPGRKTFMDDTSIIVLVLRHPASAQQPCAAEARMDGVPAGGLASPSAVVAPVAAGAPSPAPPCTFLPAGGCASE